MANLAPLLDARVEGEALGAGWIFSCHNGSENTKEGRLVVQDKYLVEVGVGSVNRDHFLPFILRVCGFFSSSLLIFGLVQKPP